MLPDAADDAHEGELRSRPAPWMTRLRDLLYDILFPGRCLGCGRLGEPICTACAQTVERVPPDRCSRCGRPLQSDRSCPACGRANFPLAGRFAVTYSTGVMRRAIHQLKYSDQAGLASLLAGYLVDWWRSNSLPVDVVMPIPLHAQRERERGYNQAALLARPFSAAVALPCDESALIRVRYTLPQVELNAAERRANVADAFRCARDLAASRVLLLDDVTTTGATLEAAAGALRQAGAAQVWGLTLARAAPRPRAGAD